MLARQLYDEITRCKDRSMGCSSHKEAAPYLQRFQFLNSRLTGPARDISSSLYSMLNEYCKQGSDKNHHSQFVRQDIMKLEDFIEGKS